MSDPAQLTLNDLRKRIVCWNLKQSALGGAILACSVFLWLLTIRGAVLLGNSLQTLPIPWNESDVLSRGLTAIVLLLVIRIGCSSRSPLFIWIKPDADFAEVELTEWRLNDQWGPEFWLALLGIAPALTFFGIDWTCRCFSLEKSRIDLACRTHAYLARQDNWVPYPKLLSQRRAVVLLYHLKLINVSKRFGNLEIRIRRQESARLIDG